jgi:PilZ domain
MSTQVCEPRGLAAAVTGKTTTKGDTRRRKRIQISLPVHLRVFDCRFRNLEDVAMVVDFTRDGLFFTTSMPHYFVGMRLEVTFPYGDKVAAHRKFIGSVVRVEDKGDKRGIAVRFLL